MNRFPIIVIPSPKLKLRLTDNYFSTAPNDRNPKDHLKIQDAARVPDEIVPKTFPFQFDQNECFPCR